MHSEPNNLLPAHLQSDATGLESAKSPMAEPATAPREVLTDEQIYSRKTLRQVLQNVGALGISTFIHTLILIILGILTMTPEILESFEMVVLNAPEEEIVLEEEMVTVELEEDMTPSEEINTDPTAAPAAGVPTAIGAATFSEAQFEADVSDSEVEPTEMAASEIKLPASVSDSLLTAIPLGSYGDPREVVDNIQQAMDRITQELVFMLEESDVLVVWVFDQSESMRNDQKEIRERINQVYTELGLADDAAGDHLLTAVTSFGSGYIRHTSQPTSNLELIKQAINEVPIDPSGAEFVCPAIVRAINDHTSYTARGQRQMALIVVSDESGNPENNVQFLETAVQAAKIAKCRTYFLGREAVSDIPTRTCVGSIHKPVPSIG